MFLLLVIIRTALVSFCWSVVNAKRIARTYVLQADRTKPTLTSHCASVTQSSDDFPSLSAVMFGSGSHGGDESYGEQFIGSSSRRLT